MAANGRMRSMMKAGKGTGNERERASVAEPADGSAKTPPPPAGDENAAYRCWRKTARWALCSVWRICDACVAKPGAFTLFGLHLRLPLPDTNRVLKVIPQAYLRGMPPTDAESALGRMVGAARRLRRCFGGRAHGEPAKCLE